MQAGIIVLLIDEEFGRHQAFRINTQFRNLQIRGWISNLWLLVFRQFPTIRELKRRRIVLCGPKAGDGLLLATRKEEVDGLTFLPGFAWFVRCNTCALSLCEPTMLTHSLTVVSRA